MRKYQDMDGYDPSRAEFGALVEEIQENFKFAAQPLRLMGVVERERFLSLKFKKNCKRSTHTCKVSLLLP